MHNEPIPTHPSDLTAAAVPTVGRVRRTTRARWIVASAALAGVSMLSIAAATAPAAATGDPIHMTIGRR
jgi:hypothetical protein